MKKKILTVATAMLIGAQALPLSSCSKNEVEKFTMPEIEYTLYNNGDFNDYSPESGQVENEYLPAQWPNYGAGDPFVMRYNGMYYLYVSSRDGMVGVRAWKSSDLIHWEVCTAEGMPEEYTGYVSVDPYLIGAYAPEVNYFNGKFYMYSSPSGGGHYIFESDSPEGPFVKTSNNFGMTIDGSVFIDDDETVYFLNANGSGITIHKMDDPGTVPGPGVSISKAIIGSWTEGPMIIKREGIYYLTYTGANVLSQAYRISYCTELDGNSITTRDSFTSGVDLPIVLTVDEANNFKGLGHSSTVLGPDMDSYYMIYHSLNVITGNGPYRSMNIDRLIFNGTQMSIDESKTSSIAANMPAFYADNTKADGKFTTEGEFVLSSDKTASVFTAEVNFKGDNVKTVVSYEDASNYIYALVNYAGHEISLHRVSGGNDTVIATGELKNDFLPDVLHTVRIAYADGKMDVYFDNMCKISNAEVKAKAGKIGCTATADAYYTAFSNVAKGYSDRIELKQSGASIGASTYLPEGYFDSVTSYKLSDKSKLEKVSIDGETYSDDAGYNNSYKLTLGKEGDFARYLTYARETGHYGLALTYETKYGGKEIGVQVNGGELETVTLPKIDAGDSGCIATAFITEFDLEAGPNIISFYGAEDSVAFISFTMEEKSYGTFSFEHDLMSVIPEGAEYSSMYRQTKNGHTTRGGSRMLCYLGDDTLSDCEIEVEMKFVSQNVYSAGVILRASNFANATTDDSTSITGYYVAVNSYMTTLSKLNHGDSQTNVIGEPHEVSADELTEHWFKLKARIEGNTVTVYLDGEQVFTYTDAHPILTGHLGFYSDGGEVSYRNLKISSI